MKELKDVNKRLSKRLDKEMETGQFVREREVIDREASRCWSGQETPAKGCLADQGGFKIIDYWSHPFRHRYSRKVIELIEKLRLGPLTLANLSVLLLISCGESSPPKPGASLETITERLLSGVRGHPLIAYHTTSWYPKKDSGAREVVETTRFLLQSPTALRIERRDGSTLTNLMIVQGKANWWYHSQDNKYSKDIPESMDRRVGDFVNENEPVIVLFLGAKPRGWGDPKNPVRIGSRAKDGVDHTTLEWDTREFEQDYTKTLWIDPEGRLRQLTRAVKGMPPDFFVDYSPISFPTEFPADSFVFVPPKGSEGQLPAEEQAALDLFPAGAIAPSIETVDASGKTFSLDSLKGKLVLLDFWNLGCVPCLKEQVRLQELHEKYKDDGLLIVAVDVGDEPDAVRRHMEIKKYGFQAVMDRQGNTAAAYKVSVYPTNYMLSREGKIVAGWVGFDEKVLDLTIKELFKK
jgi:thiol-disulfide isomerase/thioredoxin